MRIPLTDVAWQHQQVRTEIEAAIDRLLADQQCDGSALVAGLEEAFQERFPGLEAVGVQSGLAAQLLILKALGIGPGDEVITVPNTDMATTAAISLTGARPVFVDVLPDTQNMDPAQLAGAITPRTRAVVPVHMYGVPAEMAAILKIASQHSLPVVGDAALALGARYQGTDVGYLGDAVFFSFAPRKVLGGAGNGGMVVTQRPEIARQVRLLRGYGQEPNVQDRPIAERQRLGGQIYAAEGHNLKLDPIQAAIVRAKFDHMDEWGRLRQQIAARYTELLTGCPGVQIPVVRAGDQPAWRNYTILTDRREAVRAALAAEGIATALLYTPPLHLQPAYQGWGLAEGAFPVAEHLAGQLLCLPIYPGMSTTQVDQVVAVIRQIHP